MQGRIKTLYSKYLDNTLTEPERTELYEFFGVASDEDFDNIIDDYLAKNDVPEDTSHLRPDLDRIFMAVQEDIAKTKIVPLERRYAWFRYAGIAALVALTFVTGIYFIQRPSPEKEEILADVKPGHISATLTLADGRKIPLSNTSAGNIAQEAGGISISKSKDGMLIYTLAENNQENSSSSSINTLLTGRGETVQVMLQDGTKVWLNAGSSIKYPNNFRSMSDRRVEAEGEVYFEVAHNKEKPFIVKTGGQEVTVLGTRFNINNYAVEGETTTTLAQGSVRVRSLANGKTLLLTPGNQIINSSGNLEIQAADLDVALAWKNGLTYFRNAPLEQVLKEVSRWYNLEIEYEGKGSEEKFSGGIKRSANLSEVLKLLQLSNVKFTIKKVNGNTVLSVANTK